MTYYADEALMVPSAGPLFVGGAFEKAGSVVAAITGAQALEKIVITTKAGFVVDTQQADANGNLSVNYVFENGTFYAAGLAAGSISKWQIDVVGNTATVTKINNPPGECRVLITNDALLGAYTI